MGKKYLLGLAVAGVLAFSGAVPVMAQNQGNSSSGNSNSSSGNSNAGASTGSGNTDSLHSGTDTGGQIQSGQNTATQGQGLNADRKKTCEDRKGNIDKTMTQYSATIQNRLMLFNKITERIRAYYEANKLSVAQYEQLMAQVTTQQQTATEAMSQVRQGMSIDCDSGDPIGTAQLFRTKVQTAQQALQQYRLAIHNLLTAVLAAAETSEAQ
jgi:hypothetical protein